MSDKRSLPPGWFVCAALFVCVAFWAVVLAVFIAWRVFA